MKIFYIDPDIGSREGSYGYYDNIVRAISSQLPATDDPKTTNMILIHGRGYTTSVDEIIKQTGITPDLICFGYGMTNIFRGAVKHKETTILGIKDCGIPKAMFLNKEYGGSLPAKLDYMNELGIDVGFSYHHDYEQFEKITGIPFEFLPFAVDPNMFKDYGYTGEKNDLAFSGGLGHPQPPPEGQGWSHLLRREIVGKGQDPEFSSDWENIKYDFTNHRHDSDEDYAKRLNTAKIWLSTTGPVDIVGTRYYEVMATNTTMLLCNKAKSYWCFNDEGHREDRGVNVYDGLFEEDKHYVGFETYDDFMEKLHYYKENEDERQKIVSQAYDHVLANHTWTHRAKKFLGTCSERFNIK